VNNVEALLTLVQRDANKDAQDSYDQTPLFLAAREGSREAVRALLDAGANRDIADHMDRLPRQMAVERLHHDIAQMLDDYSPPRRYQPPAADGVLLQADCLMSKGKQKKGILTVIIIIIIIVIMILTFFAFNPSELYTEEYKKIRRRRRRRRKFIITRTYNSQALSMNRRRGHSPGGRMEYVNC